MTIRGPTELRWRVKSPKCQPNRFRELCRRKEDGCDPTDYVIDCRRPHGVLDFKNAILIVARTITALNHVLGFIFPSFAMNHSWASASLAASAGSDMWGT